MIIKTNEKPVQETPAESQEYRALKRAAEQQLEKISQTEESSRSLEEILHDLEVHQIELEMQNEELRRAQSIIEESRERYVDFYDFAPVGYVTLCTDGKIEDINLTGATLIGEERNKLKQRNFMHYVAPEDRDRWQQHFMKALQHDKKFTCELSILGHSGGRLHVQLDSLRLLKYGKVALLRVAMTDVSELKHAEEEIRNLAFYDSLTQLPNRRMLDDRMNLAMAASKRSGHYCALMFLDLDNFKPLNDLYGHNVGDMLLIEVAHRISSCLREMDTVARFGGDEFVVMLSELDADKESSIAQTRIVAEKIRTILAQTYFLTIKVNGNTEIRFEHNCTSSIGVVVFKNHEFSTHELLKLADREMYQAKENGRNQVCLLCV